MDRPLRKLYNDNDHGSGPNVRLVTRLRYLGQGNEVNTSQHHRTLDVNGLYCARWQPDTSPIYQDT
jgi:hypothetical protein